MHCNWDTYRIRRFTHVQRAMRPAYWSVAFLFWKRPSRRSRGNGGDPAANANRVADFDQRHPVKKPFRAHLPRERVVIAAPSAFTAVGQPAARTIPPDIAWLGGAEPAGDDGL